MVRGQKKARGPAGPKTNPIKIPQCNEKSEEGTPSTKITAYFSPSADVESKKKSPAILQQANDNKSSPHRIEMTKRSRKKEGQNKLTDYFPVRRSVRKTKRTVMEEMQKKLEDSIISKREEGLQVHIFEGKGRGIVATTTFNRGDFVVEYAGDLISAEEAKEREAIYSRDQNTGCYMYYFRYKGDSWCIDATSESDRLGRLVNHSRSGNLCTKAVCIEGQPHLVLLASTTIVPGEEVTYDYGDRSKDSLKNHPWLAF